MARQLLVQSCSETKQESDSSLPAIERYDGYFYQIIKKARSEGKLDPSLDICILSAEYGLVDKDEPIPYYDRRMDIERADELRDDVLSALRQKMSEKDYDRVIINMGEVYQRAITGIDDTVGPSVVYIQGGGIGQKGHILKQIIRVDADAKCEFSGHDNTTTAD